MRQLQNKLETKIQKQLRAQMVKVIPKSLRFLLPKLDFRPTRRR